MLLEKIISNKKLISLSPDKIVPSPFQPRREFDYYNLLELAASIQKNGLIQPITVRRKGDYYELISGERRLRACILIGLKKISCMVITANDQECSVMCLIENMQRKDLNFFEEADGIKRLMNDFSLSSAEVSEKLGIAQSTLSNKLRLLKLSVEHRERITSAGLSERHARELIRLPNDKRDEILNQIIAKQLTVAQTEVLVNDTIAPIPLKNKPIKTGSIGDIRIFSNSLLRIIGSIRKSGVDAKSHKEETDSYIEYTITIPKTKKGDSKLTVL